jgi:hypothetical protein
MKLADFDVDSPDSDIRGSKPVHDPGKQRVRA